MTDMQTFVVALVVALPPTLAAMAGLIQSRLNAAKSDTIIEKANEIHVLTNSNLTAVKAALAEAQEKIESLEQLVTQLAMSKGEPVPPIPPSTP